MTEKTRIWWKDAEMITALSAVLIGVVALVIGAYQAKVASDQRAASVWPYLEVSRYSTQSESFGFYVINKGVGPAIIKKMDVLVNNEPVKKWPDAFKLMLKDDSPIQSIYSSTNKAVIAVQEKRKMVDLQNPSTIQKLQNSEDNIEIKICYCSIFNDCWLTGRGLDTQEVSSCNNTLEDFFEQ